jgi:hypothetical protein
MQGNPSGCDDVPRDTDMAWLRTGAGVTVGTPTDDSGADEWTLAVDRTSFLTRNSPLFNLPTFDFSL